MIYVADWGHHRIVVFDSSGARVGDFGGFGKNDPTRIGDSTRFVFPNRIAIIEPENGEPLLFVTDWYGVHWLDTQGSYFGSIHILPEGSAAGVKVDLEGQNFKLRVANRSTHKVITFLSRPI